MTVRLQIFSIKATRSREQSMADLDVSRPAVNSWNEVNGHPPGQLGPVMAAARESCAESLQGGGSCLSIDEVGEHEVKKGGAGEGGSG
jgi:hypothetical protein